MVLIAFELVEIMNNLTFAVTNSLDRDNSAFSNPPNHSVIALYPQLNVHFSNFGCTKASAERDFQKRHLLIP